MGLISDNEINAAAGRIMESRALVEDEGDVPMYLNPSDFFEAKDGKWGNEDWVDATNLLSDALDDKPTYAAIRKAVVGFLKKKVDANANYKVKP